jgi:hypothetical protein
MTKCSGKIDAHDRAAGVGEQPPSLDEMKKDLEELRKFRVEQKKKSSAQDAALKHLKA